MAGLSAVTITAPSTPDLAGVVIDLQPTGPVAPGSTVTITVGDGTAAPVTDPPADASGGGGGHGNGKGKGKKGD